jgi:hypothetical protein
MKRLLLWAPSMALIAACSGSAVSLQPGQWETTIRMTSVEMPGAPEAMVAQMRQAASAPQTSSECMTPEEAANPASKMMNPGGGANSCQFTESTFAGGAIRVRGTCSPPGAGRQQMSMEGSYTSTTMEARITAEMQAPPGANPTGPQSVRVSGTMTGRRTGDCPHT